jgi:hypothetical protein
MHTRPLQRAHRRSVSQATEEVDKWKVIVHGGRPYSWTVSPWRVFETLEKNFAADHPAALRREIRRETNNDSGATG